jgi:hypothetical protein
MDFVDIFVLVMFVAAAIAAYVIYAMRGGRTVSREPAVPRLAGLKLKPVSETPPAARPSAGPVTGKVAAPAPPPRAPASPAAPAPAAPEAAAPVGAASASLFDVETEPAVATPPGEIRWWKQFDSRSEALDDVARLRLIGDLGVVAKEWCVPLLAQAYGEEQKRSHRQAALTSLTACHSRAAATVFRAALASGDAAEHAIAADGLADLEPAQQAKVRRTVERF